MSSDPIPFNRPHLTGRELTCIAQAQFGGMLSGDGSFTRRCHALIESQWACRKALLTHSCTAALEMAALLTVGPGDEVIMPSYTFVSTANPFVLRGAVPVFIDIREDTLNLDERLIESAITPRTRAIVPVHYAGVGCEMDSITAVARHHRLRIIEDAAQGTGATYRGHALGSLGDLGALSFHETKNVISGEGGCLLINEDLLVARAEIIREKGTDRSRFFRGEVDKYSWQDLGSSYLPSELIAAFLLPQLEEIDQITRARVKLWDEYHELLAPLEGSGLIRRPVVPKECRHNGHMYYLLLREGLDRKEVLRTMKDAGIGAIFHYVPLHSSPGGRRYGKAHGDLSVTDSASERLIRLPMWLGLRADQQCRVVETLSRAISNADGLRRTS